MTISLLPLAFATWVAISRLEDNRHHKEDVIVGALIGVFTATTSYLIYWPNPFTLRNADMDRGAARPKLVYRQGELDVSRNNYDYELAGMENEHAVENV